VVSSDTSEGVSEEFLPYVFDRFKQADTGIARAYGGLGLGLAIVRNLTELHGGTVGVHSGGKGKGSTFTVQIPITIHHSSDTLPVGGDALQIHSSVLKCPPVIEGLRVLVVDDEPDARRLLAAILKPCKARVTAAASAAEAIQTLDWLQPDIIISDIEMPGEDGYSLISKVRALENEQNQVRVPAIAVTAHARPEDRLRALSAGFQSHVSKPLEPIELVTVIASLVTRKNSGP
jgi:CheY-like chemotaxis protein